jgi:threonine aldolase
MLSLACQSTVSHVGMVSILIRASTSRCLHSAITPHHVLPKNSIQHRRLTMTTANGHSVDPKSSNGYHKKVNAWQTPGPSAFDLRSDTMTTPNEEMLEAIKNTTLLDDVFLEDPTTNDLEAHVARLTGHEAALLVMSGTMGNQIALRTHLTTPPYSVLCDRRGHIINYEAGGVSLLSGAMTIPVTPSNGHHLTLADIQSHAIISDDVHACPTRVISLENTLWGTILPLTEFRAISTWAHEHNILIHLDGARIWEAASSPHPQSGSLSDYTTLCDSVSLCFSKGLGAPIGSIIVGRKPFIDRARHFRKVLGGGTRQAGVISAAARVGVDRTFGKGPRGEGGLLRATHERARNLAERWTAAGGKLQNPTETNMIWLDLAAAGVSGDEFVEAGRRHGVKLFEGRVVVHYQVTDEAVERMNRVMDDVLALGKRKSANGTATPSKKRGPENVYAAADTTQASKRRQQYGGDGEELLDCLRTTEFLSK